MKSDIRHKVLQGLAGLAVGRGLGCRLLQAEQEVSQSGFVWNHKSVAPIFSFGGGKHCGRTRSGKFCLVRPVFTHSSRFTERDRNSHYHCRKVVSWLTGGTGGSAGYVRRIGQNGQVADPCYSGQKMTKLFAIRYSLLLVAPHD